MSSIGVAQDYHVILTSKSVDWLVNKTTVRVFDAVSFNGYQRQIDPKHCQKIVNYIKESFHLPSAIICACEKYSDDERLFIVDGQHRVKAFELLREQDPKRYGEIACKEMPVVVMIGVPLEVEIDTFITINKTSKKVDTSLAYVLKSKLSQPQYGDMAMPKSEYVAVESAMLLNNGMVESQWRGNILFEGVVKFSDCYISLNAFVRVTRVLVNVINKLGVINLNWHTEEEVKETIHFVAKLIAFIWDSIFQRWPELYTENHEDREIIQGSIGYTAITRAIVILLREQQDIHNLDDLHCFIKKTVMSFNIGYQKWLRMGDYAHYSSEYGYKIVADELMKSTK